MAEKAGKRDYRTADERAAQMIDAAHTIIERERSTELSLRDVADAVGVNVSTVSRAISGKWFQAPGMIRELRSLFTSGTVRDDGAQESRGGVIARIQELVEKEDPRKPLSDAQIVKRLAEKGVRISRRTVTKYREAEAIPSSRERRQH